MENIEIKQNDYKTILSYKGKIDGIVDSCNINEFLNCIEGSLKKSISKAKGILINFILHEEQSLFIITDYMAAIHNLADEDADIIFNTEQVLNIDKDKIYYEIITTGL